MSKNSPFVSIGTAELGAVVGGASRVTARSSSSSDQLTTMMSQITDSIKQLGQNQNQGMDPMMMMMMMMMGGGGGGGGQQVAAAPPPQPPPAPVINISNRIG